MSVKASALVAKIDLPGAGVGDNFGAGALDDDLAEVQQRDALGEVEGDVHATDSEPRCWRGRGRPLAQATDEPCRKRHGTTTETATSRISTAVAP